MMVEIPDDVAKQYAAVIRQPIEWPEGTSREALADLLDPQPPTLRERVAAVIDSYTPERHADAVLAVVADWLAAQPLVYWGSQTWGATQRDHDVRLLRGASDA